MGNYYKYTDGITEICNQYGYTRCQHCPLFAACSIENDPDKTQEENTREWEEGMVKAYLEYMEK